MKNAERLCLLILFGIAGCTSGTETLPESTTTLIGPAGGVAKSADGLMELRFAAGSLGGERAITIETRRDVTAEHLASLVYRVFPSPLDAPLEIWFHTDANAQIGTLDSGRFEAISGTKRDGPSLQVSMASLAYSMLAAVEEVEVQPVDPPDGWDDVPGTGNVFIVDAFTIAGDGGALAGLGEFLNDELQRQLVGGELLMLVELAGIDAGFAGDDDSVTVKFYAAADADDPFFPANNFAVPPGHIACCEFLIKPQSITSDPTPRARSRAPARIVGGMLETLSPVPLQLILGIGAPPHPALRLERVLFSAELDASLSALSNGRLESAFPMSTLAQWENSSCKQPGECAIQFGDSTILDLATALLGVSPDVDLDVPEDGLSCAIDTDGDARVDRCCLGNGAGACSVDNICSNGEAAPLLSEPWSCALNPAMADGFSVHFGVTGVRASAVGFGP